MDKILLMRVLLVLSTACLIAISGDRLIRLEMSALKGSVDVQIERLYDQTPNP